MALPKLQAAARRLAGLLRRRKQEAQMAEEMRAHLDGLAERNVAAGLSPAEARYAALRAFGGVEQIKERAREQRRSLWVERLLQDVRVGIRSLRKQPGFALVTIATLALGIGANTAIFSVVDAVAFRPLPVIRPDELIALSRVSDGHVSDLSYPAYRYLRDHARLASGLMAARTSLRTLADNGAAIEGGGPRVTVSEVSGNFFPTLGVVPLAGRGLTPNDDADGAAAAVAVISHAFWERHFVADPAIVGRTVWIDHVACTVVGIAPPEFRGISAAETVDLWVPVQLGPRLDNEPASKRLNNDTLARVAVMGRLAAGVTIAEARAELAVLFQAKQDEAAVTVGKNWPAKARQQQLAARLDVQPGGAGHNVQLLTELKPLLTVLWMVVALVFLIACANVASLLLVRGFSRRRELGVRAALGASRGRLLGQLLVESLLLAAAGGAIGLTLARAGAAVLVTQVQAQTTLDFSPDRRVFGFSAAISLVAALLIGLMPALRFSRPDLIGVLKDQAGAIASVSRLWFNRILIVAQIAISLCLLAGAGLFVRTLQNLYGVDAGFERRNVVLFALTLDKTANDAHKARLIQDVADRLQSLPGVQSASFSMGGMGRGAAIFGISVEGYTPALGEDVTASFTMAGPRYFETLGTPLVQGREYRWRGFGTATAPTESEAVINTFMARKFFGSASPLGRKIKFLGQTFVIVGVARDAKYGSLRDTASSQMYVPFFDSPLHPSWTMFQVRTTGDLRQLTALVQGAVRQLEPGAGVTALTTMGEIVDQSLAQERTIARAAGAFGVVALLLAALGLYGALAFNVTQRTREIGVRMALGAESGDVLGLVIRQGMTLVLFGAALGLVLAPMLTRLVRSQLYGVTASDPLTFALALLALVVVALLACWLPARRAAKVDPMVALRCE